MCSLQRSLPPPLRLVVRFLQPALVQLPHLEHRVHHALRPRGIAAATEQTAELLRDDLPRQPELVLEPAAPTRRPAVGGELVPQGVDLLLSIAPDEEGHRLVELEQGPGVERHEFLALELVLDGHYLSVRAVNGKHLRSREDRRVVVHRLFGLRVEPEEWRNGQHGWLLVEFADSLESRLCHQVGADSRISTSASLARSLSPDTIEDEPDRF